MLLPWVKHFIGIPFVGKGRVREGADCWGLVVVVFQEEFGIQLPTFASNYSCVKDWRGIARSIKHESRPLFEPISDEELLDAERPVAVLLHERGLPLHCAVWAGCDNGQRYVLHTTEARGHSYLERLDGPELATSEPVFYRHHTRGVGGLTPVRFLGQSQSDLRGGRYRQDGGGHHRAGTSG